MLLNLVLNLKFNAISNNVFILISISIYMHYQISGSNLCVKTSSLLKHNTWTKTRGKNVYYFTRQQPTSPSVSKRTGKVTK
jgi:hypothetical protein